MSHYYTLGTIQPEQATSRVEVERVLRLKVESMSVSDFDRKAFLEVEERFWAKDHIVLWHRWFEAILECAAGEEGEYVEPSTDPLTWAVTPRHTVPETARYSEAFRVRYNTPGDTAAVSERLGTVTAEELGNAIARTLASPAWCDWAPKRDPDVAIREMVFWGTLRAFYARAAAERRYVVLLIS